MQYIEAPNCNEILYPDNSIFLAGGISNVIPWQTELKEKLQTFDNVTVINPRRNDFKFFVGVAGFEESKKQITWEFKHLRLAKQVVFWFSNETVQPIVLFELAAALERGNQDILIGCHPDYVRKFDVQVQANLKGYHHEVEMSFEDFLNKIIILQKNYEMSLKRK